MIVTKSFRFKSGCGAALPALAACGGAKSSQQAAGPVQSPTTEAPKSTWGHLLSRPMEPSRCSGSPGRRSPGKP